MEHSNIRRTRRHFLKSASLAATGALLTLPARKVFGWAGPLDAFWNGAYHLGAPEHVIINGSTHFGALSDPGRFTLTQVGGVFYAFCRQQNPADHGFEIYRCVSGDGVQFDIPYNPIIPQYTYCENLGSLVTAADGDIREYGGQYYLCFEGAEWSGFSSVVAR